MDERAKGRRRSKKAKRVRNLKLSRKKSRIGQKINVSSLLLFFPHLYAVRLFTMK
jgi:hypothetical protein